ncbi:MAG: DUF3847 domain-containing protein [Oribacterium sp.]|nr:DUF3847 domain-containing protein [Oribacterium sp.]
MKNTSDFTELQLKHQQEMKEKRDSIKLRKERTHRLIVRGAIAENAIPGSIDMTDEQFQDTLLRAIRRGSAVATSHPQDSHGSAPRESPSEDPAEQPSAERTHHDFRCDV